MLQPVAGPRTPLLLIFSGSLPFLAGAFLLVTGVGQVGGSLDVVELVASYTLVIGTFLCGIHWGQQLSFRTAGLNLFFLSNLTTLVLWFGWIFLSRQGFLLLAVVHFWLMWAVDLRLIRAGCYQQVYYSARTTITTVVSICLLASALFI